MSEKVAESASGTRIILKYYLTEKISKDVSIFGIEIEKQIVHKDHESQDNFKNFESEIVDNITYSKEEVLGLIAKFSYHFVTPVTLINIIDEYQHCS